MWLIYSYLYQEVEQYTGPTRNTSDDQLDTYHKEYDQIGQEYVFYDYISNKMGWYYLCNVDPRIWRHEVVHATCTLFRILSIYTEPTSIHLKSWTRKNNQPGVYGSSTETKIWHIYIYVYIYGHSKKKYILSFKLRLLTCAYGVTHPGNVAHWTMCIIHTHYASNVIFLKHILNNFNIFFHGYNISKNKLG